MSAGRASSFNLRRMLRQREAIVQNAAFVAQQEALPQFERTPATVAATALTRVIRHWNAPLSTRCCPLHAQLETLLGLVNRMTAEMECNLAWSIHSGWQCGKCKYMNSEDDFECPQCAECLDD